MRHHVSLAKKMVTYLLATCTPLTKPHPGVSAAFISWVESLSCQLKSVAAPNAREHVKEGLPSAQEVLAWQAQLEQEALQLLEEDLEVGDEVEPSTARTLHNTALLALMFGHTPPPRLACLRTAKHPDRLDLGACTDPDCSNPETCKSNRLEWVDGKHGEQLMAQFPHHKNEGRWGNRAISFELPDHLNQVVLPYILHGHSVLTNGPYLFLNFQNQPMSPANLTQWFQRLQASEEAPWQQRFPPYMLRHIFVNERSQGEGAAPGPSNTASAMVMGNSTQAWKSHYDVHFKEREAQAAVNDMAAWRSTLLKGGHNSSSSSQEGSGSEE